MVVRVNSGYGHERKADTRLWAGSYCCVSVGILVANHIAEWKCAATNFYNIAKQQNLAVALVLQNLRVLRGVTLPLPLCRFLVRLLPVPEIHQVVAGFGQRP